MHGRVGASYFSVRASVTDDGNGNHHIVIVIKKWARLSPFAEAGADTCFLKARNGTCGFCLLLGISEGRQLIVSLASERAEGQNLSLKVVIFVPRFSRGLKGLQLADVTR